MAIGTSAGEYFEDAFEHSASRFGPITDLIPAENESYPSSQGSPETNVRASKGQEEASGKVSIIRHGATEYNAEGNTITSQDKIRGHLDIPLNDLGRKEAHNLGSELNASKDPPDLLVSSDLERAHETAHIISQKTGIPLMEVHNGFRPWDVGKYSGKPTEDAIPHLKDFAENKPNEPVPGGESFNEFKDRAISNIARVVQENPGKHIGVVTHHRVGQLMEALDQKTGDIDINKFAQKGKAPGTIATHEFKMAGEVIPMGKEEGLHTGYTNQSADYAWGLKKDPQVEPIPIDVTKAWMSRTAAKWRK